LSLLKTLIQLYMHVIVTTFVAKNDHYKYVTNVKWWFFLWRSLWRH